MKVNEFDFEPVVELLEQAIEGLKAKPKKVSKREKALLDIKKRMNSGSFLCNFDPRRSLYNLDYVLSYVNFEIDKMIEEG